MSDIASRFPNGVRWTGEGCRTTPTTPQRSTRARPGAGATTDPGCTPTTSTTRAGRGASRWSPGTPLSIRDDLAVADAVVARLFRRTSSDQTWLEVVSEEGRDVRMVATLDSAGRLLTVLHDLLSNASP